MGKNTRLKKLARHLLATTCLTAGAAALANAQVVTEAVPPAPTDFGNTFGAAYLLPDGTTTVNGAVEFGSDIADYFTFHGLQGGTNFNFTATSTDSRLIGIDLFNSSDVQIGVEEAFDSVESATGSGSVPSDGILTFGLLVDGSGEGTRPYSVELNATQSSTPEPGTLGVMGLGLAAGAALAKRRKKKI